MYRKFFIAAVAVASVPFVAATAAATTVPVADQKVHVCRYVGKPGVNEKLKPGKNPISVSVAATGIDPKLPADKIVGTVFSSAHGRSFVIAWDYNSGYSPSCPATVPGGVAPVVTPSPTGSNSSPSPTPTGSNSSPSPTPTPSTPAPTPSTPAPSTPAPTPTTPAPTPTTPAPTPTTTTPAPTGTPTGTPTTPTGTPTTPTGTPTTTQRVQRVQGVQDKELAYTGVSNITKAAVLAVVALLAGVFLVIASSRKRGARQ